MGVFLQILSNSRLYARYLLPKGWKTPEESNEGEKRNGYREDGNR